MYEPIVVHRNLGATSSRDRVNASGIVQQEGQESNTCDEGRTYNALSTGLTPTAGTPKAVTMVRTASTEASAILGCLFAKPLTSSSMTGSDDSKTSNIIMQSSVASVFVDSLRLLKHLFTTPAAAACTISSVSAPPVALLATAMATITGAGGRWLRRCEKGDKQMRWRHGGWGAGVGAGGL